MGQAEVRILLLHQSVCEGAFLCGTGLVTGQRFDRRKLWVQDLGLLAGRSGIDVLA